MTTCLRPSCTAPAQTRGWCESDYRRQIRMGRLGWRPVTRAREHVGQLRVLGWTWEQIATSAGLSTWVPHRLGTGRTRWIRVESERALLSVPLVPHDSHRGVDPTGTRRRIQALAWMGWPAAEVAVRAGTTPATLRTLILPHRRPSVALARRVARVYDELSMVPGPSAAAASKARGLGFAPPLAWDDETIDDPQARPCGKTRRAA